MAAADDRTDAPVVQARARYVRTRAPQGPRRRRPDPRHRRRGRDRAAQLLAARRLRCRCSSCVRSAAANAENNFDLDPEDMRITGSPSTRARRCAATARAPAAARPGSRSAAATSTIALTPIPDAD